MAAIRLTAAPNYSGDVTVKLIAGTFESATAENGIPNASQFKVFPDSFNAVVKIDSVSDVPTLSVPVLNPGWRQDRDAVFKDNSYEVSVPVNLVSGDSTSPAETLYLYVRKAELTAAGATLVGNPFEHRIAEVDYFGIAASNAEFKVLVPYTVSQPLKLWVLAGSSDQSATLAYSQSTSIGWRGIIFGGY